MPQHAPCREGSGQGEERDEGRRKGLKRGCFSPRTIQHAAPKGRRAQKFLPIGESDTMAVLSKHEEAAHR